jgi:glycerol-3-phosphate acyltransferase PlsY
MPILLMIGLFILAYAVGSIPFGFILVKIFTGRDVTQVQSGRTGGTNSMRAAGFAIGLATSLLDIIKSASVVWLAKDWFPDRFWIQVITGLVAVIGHNYSVFLIKRSPEGKLEVGGGAGGTPAAGAIVGLWWPSFFILVPAGFLIVMVVGYASLATMTLPLIGSLIFLVRFLTAGEPWEYIFSGLFSEILILWALRPNIQRLLEGNERLVGFRARKRSRKGE